MSPKERARETTDQALQAWGRWLAGLRRARGLTQAELAAELGVTRGAVGHYESGRRPPDLSTVVLWVRVCTGQDLLPELGDCPLCRVSDSPLPGQKTLPGM